MDALLSPAINFYRLAMRIADAHRHGRSESSSSTIDPLTSKFPGFFVVPRGLRNHRKGTILRFMAVYCLSWSTVVLHI